MKQTEARNGRKKIAQGKRRENERRPGFNKQNRILPLLAKRGEGWGEESNGAKPIQRKHSMVCDLRMNPELKPPNEGVPQRDSVKKADGVTAAEKYLARLCEKSFLS